MNVVPFSFVFLYGICYCYSNTVRVCNDNATSSDINSLNDDCLCPPGKQCLRKCCLPNEMKRDQYGNCTFTNDTINLAELPFYGNMTNFKFAFNSSDHLHIIHGQPCGKYYILYPKTEYVSVTTDGLLQSDSDNVTLFCLEYVEEEDEVLPFVCHFEDEYGNENDFNANSSSTEPSNSKILMGYVVMIGYLLSITFLSLTLIVYITIPLLHTTLNGKNMMCYAFASLVGFLFLFLIKGTEIGLFHLDSPFCEYTGLLVQFSFLASFFWLNIMCFDLWWVFSGFRSVNGSPKERDKMKFVLYCLYAWGCPTLIVILTIVMEYFPGIPELIPKPELGKTNCWFSSKMAVFVYFYSFISLIVLCNMCMFVSTSLTLKKHKRETKVLMRSGSRRHVGSVDKEEKQRFNLYLKLFAIMGINWILDLASFYYPNLDDQVWQFTDIANSIQGVLVFLIFVCKKRTLIVLNKKLCPFMKIFRATSNHSVYSTTVTSASVNGASRRTGSKKIPLSIIGLPNDTKVQTTV